VLASDLDNGMHHCFLILLFSVLLGVVEAQAESLALIVIDMQPNFAARSGHHQEPSNAAKIDAVLRRQLHLVKLAKNRELPIFLVEYVLCDDTYACLKAEIDPYWQSLTVPKSKDGLFDPKSFSSALFRRFLSEREITGLIVVGANGGACVYQTIRDALEKGFRVCADSEGIIQYDMEEFIHPYVYREDMISEGPGRFEQGDAVELFDLESRESPSAIEINSPEPPCEANLRVTAVTTSRRSWKERLRKIFTVGT
jgi:hypothetical protein